MVGVVGEILRILTVGAAPSHLIFFLYYNHHQNKRPEEGCTEMELNFWSHKHSASVTASVSLPTTTAIDGIASPSLA